MRSEAIGLTGLRRHGHNIFDVGEEPWGPRLSKLPSEISDRDARLEFPAQDRAPADSWSRGSGGTGVGPSSRPRALSRALILAVAMIGGVALCSLAVVFPGGHTANDHGAHRVVGTPAPSARELTVERRSARTRVRNKRPSFVEPTPRTSAASYDRQRPNAAPRRQPGRPEPQSREPVALYRAGAEFSFER
jgi:hypothetical protein